MSLALARWTAALVAPLCAGGSDAIRAQAPHEDCVARRSIETLLAELDACFARGDLAALLAVFVPDHAGAHAKLRQRLQCLFSAGVALRCASTLTSEPRRMGPRTVASVRHEIRQEAPAGQPRDGGAPPLPTIVEDVVLVVRVGDDGRAVPTLLVETMATKACTDGSRFRCPPCNFEIGGLDGWLCVPMRSERAQALEAATFYRLGSDLACDVVVCADDGSPAATGVADQLAHALRHGCDARAGGPPGVGRAVPWLPKAHRDAPPAGMSGASIDVELPRGTPGAHNERVGVRVVTFGGLQHVLLARGSERSLREHEAALAELLDSYRLLELDASAALAAARAFAAHTGGRLDGGTYRNERFGVELRGPDGWKAGQRCGGAAFRVVWSDPDGRGRLWLYGYAVPAGMPGWCTETAERWLHELSDRAGYRFEPAGEADRQRDAAGWCESSRAETRSRLFVGRPADPDAPDAPRERLLLLRVTGKLLLVADGYAVRDADAAAVRRAIESLR
jgi:hypothetical protein